MPDVHRWVAQPHAYVVAHYAILGRTLAIAVALAVVLALIAAEVFTWDYRGASIHPQDTIWYLFHREDREGLPLVTVKTTGGMVFVGPVRTFGFVGRAEATLNETEKGNPTAVSVEAASSKPSTREPKPPPPNTKRCLRTFSKPAPATVTHWGALQVSGWGVAQLDVRNPARRPSG